MRQINIPLSLLLLVASPTFGQQTKFTTSDTEWNYDSLGNHRVVVEIPRAGKVAQVAVEWRRRDFNPEDKQFFIVSAKTNQKINNATAISLTRESGSFLFEPIAGAGRYYIYYMPYYRKGSPYYPQSVYYHNTNTATSDWLAIAKKETPIIGSANKIEAVNSFNSFDPMEIIATKQETKNFIAKYFTNKPFGVIPEDRLYPIKMTNDLPFYWTKKTTLTSFADTADRGENFAFQLGVYAFQQDLKNVQIHLSDLKNGNNAIPSTAVSVLNTDGIDWQGKKEHWTVNVPQSQIQAFWVLVNVPKETKAGIYQAIATIQADGLPAQKIPISIRVNNKIAVNNGTNEPWKQTRLAWLNSRLAQDNALFAPYTPVKLSDTTLSILGRKIGLAPTGFPAMITSYFTEEMTEIGDSAKQIITEPIHFHVKNAAGKDFTFRHSSLIFNQKDSAKYNWSVTNQNEQLQMDVNGSLEFDGFMDYEVKLIAKQDVSLNEVTLHLPFQPNSAKYFMGLGHKGELRPDTIDWKWNVATKNQDGAWIGDINSGIQFGLRDQHYSRPLNTNFYLKKPLLLPTSWGNDNKGGIRVSQKGAAILADCYSGARTMHKGDTLYYNFRLLITPFHPIQTDFQWQNRFVHKHLPVNEAKNDGATVINIHQGTAINPYINYPFIKTKEMKAYIDSAHNLGLKVKIYNTVRELSNRAYEIPATFSLGNEIFSKGKGGGYAWLQEHLDTNYIAAWYTPEAHDAAIINSGMSRWHNYYVEGMQWLTQNIGIDGIYLDDVAFDRTVMKRIKKVMTENGHPGLIDLHSANQYNPADGYINSANLYLELFPYLNRLWFGENFDYENNSPEFYLTEMSGIPFGLMGEMLQNNGNTYRGMLYGMTTRLFWEGAPNQIANPRPIWNLWNKFGMKESKMLGYWSQKNPVHSNNKNVLCTVYKKKDALLISLASWAKNVETIKLTIDWKSLDWNQDEIKTEIPEVVGLQNEQKWNLNEDLDIAPNKGKFILIKKINTK